MSVRRRLRLRRIRGLSYMRRYLIFGDDWSVELLTFGWRLLSLAICNTSTLCQRFMNLR